MGLLSNWSARAKMALDGEAPPSESGVVPTGPHAEDDDMAQRMTWDTICHSDQFRGRWVALDECRYDEETGRATEGQVVDVDDDLVELCARIRESQRTNCAILFCGEDGEQGPPSH
jgi:hypothetical protein